MPKCRNSVVCKVKEKRLDFETTIKKGIKSAKTGLNTTRDCSIRNDSKVIVDFCDETLRVWVHFKKTA